MMEKIRDRQQAHPLVMRHPGRHQLVSAMPRAIAGHCEISRFIKTVAPNQPISLILRKFLRASGVRPWLFPDDDARERLHPDFFRPIVQMALEGGEIYTTEDRSGTALWLPVTAHHEDQPGLGELYEPILGADNAKRIAAFDERSIANHPDHEDHFYLPFIAVRPQFFDQGIGTALLPRLRGCTAARAHPSGGQQLR